MKKYNVLKVIAICFLVVVVLTWMIPAGTYSSGAFAQSGTAPFGIFDLTRIPLIAITNLLQYSLVILVVGGLYGVLSKTGVYTSFVDSISKKYKGKEKSFLILSILVFAILSSVVGASAAIFLLVPFFVAVILLLGYNKMTAMLSTIGAMLVGSLAATTSTSVMVSLTQYFSLNLGSEILAKIVLLVMLVVLYVLFVTKMSKVEKPKTKKVDVKKEKVESKTKKTTTKKDTKTTKAETKKKDAVVVKEEKVEMDIPLYNAKEINKKKSFVPLLIIFLLIFVVSLVAMFDWTNLLKVTFFDNIYESIMGIKIGEYTIVKNLLGTLSPFGYWTNYELIMFIALCVPFIAWLYNVKISDALDGFVSGAKQVLKPAIYVLFACLLYAAMFSNQTGSNIFFTIQNFLLGLSGKFNAFVIAAISFVGGIFFSDFPAFIGAVATPITSTYADANMYPIMGFILQTVYGLVMFIGPSSMLMILGLTYFDISYKDWFKTIWKYLVKVLIAIVLIVIVMALFL